MKAGSMLNLRRLIFLPVLLLAAACAQATPMPPLPTSAPTATAAPTVEPTSVPVPTVENSPSHPIQKSSIRIINAAADTPPLNVFLGFQAIATNLDFSQFTESTPVDADTYTVKISPSGAPTSDAPLLET